ncbi:MAG TPA: imelysin family protein [Mucilaginibacter sp.]
MKTKFILTLSVIGLTIAGCSKSNDSTKTDTSTQTTLEQGILADFAANLANPNYQDIQAKAQVMNSAITTFNATPTDANLEAVRTAWKNTRAAWESCEGFLFGPVEDYNYDPTMDDWPVNKTDLDAVLASSSNLTVSDIDQLGTTLKGFHAIEYVIFGVGGTQKAANVSARDKVYLASLGESLLNTTTQLRNSWDPASGNYTTQVVTAGKGSTTFTTRQSVFLALVGSMADICNEVANEKMQNPLTAQDSTLDESQFSHNSVTDFKNNITGVLNAYKCQYPGAASGHSLSELVASKNASLDLKIQSQINTAIASFIAITTTYEKAIYTQKNQIKTVQTAINTLKATIEGDLETFVQTNIKD